MKSINTCEIWEDGYFISTIDWYISISSLLFFLALENSKPDHLDL